MKSAPSLQPQLAGEWIGKYHGHFEEVIRIDLINGVWTATKITGDENVPAGEITWRVDPSTGKGEDKLLAKDSLNPPLSRVTSRFYPPIKSSFTGKSSAMSNTAETINYFPSSCHVLAPPLDPAKAW